ncbi:hypothetical protein ACFY2H_04800 [Streptomyces griseofuscus]|uniref:Uncharacterized protein n=1 Tax=Streptomyces griseofuscus TaxID=146922 RepID=A0A3R8QCM9_9ACTN|nr:MULTISPECIES: hypothetical protein [Streptomyces]BBC98364.1 hypothetical protein SRO_7188 [Streptomyces rochei]MBA9043561.1 hypothetical protein [Streptomyces murinus]QNT97750.1 hypothetical protein HEP81_07518 [Streptomyces griseofuscus]RRQ73558.1 hypothetical protein CQW39_29950 [Streptomyces griseofuscus]RRQ86506.1 hypothetical protein CQW44_11565 [Streptomyces griseofuscus]
MSLDLTELTRFGRALEEAHSLLEADRKRLEQRCDRASRADGTAGGPTQTLYGVTLMSGAMSQALTRVALAAGYSALGMDERAEHELVTARMYPVGFPSGADRMARPLGEATVQAMELIRDLGFFDAEISIAVDVALAAPQATYPPADWDEYERQRRSQAE